MRSYFCWCVVSGRWCNFVCYPNAKTKVVAKGMTYGIGGKWMSPPWPTYFGQMVLSLTWWNCGRKGNTPLLVPNKNDDPSQWLPKDVLGSNLVWEGQFIRKDIWLWTMVQISVRCAFFTLNLDQGNQWYGLFWIQCCSITWLYKFVDM